MKRSDIKYLYYITRIVNVPSIMEHGILCHNMAEHVSHQSVAMEEVQERRKNKVIPGAGKLHDFVNLYLNVRNPMMYKRKDMHRELCILAVDSKIFDEQGVIISDMNAAKDIARFYSPDEGLTTIDKEMLFAEFWTHDDDVETAKHRGLMCAEVLVPKKISAKFILGAFVSSEDSESELKSICLGIKTKVKPELFFQ